MGPDYVVAMCHDIEDPTFDATATATNPRAQVRPIHRPPRVPADRVPHCHWTVTIADTHPVLPVPAEAEAMAATRAAGLELAPIDPDDPGRHHYRGPLLADLQFSRLVGFGPAPDRRRSLPAGSPAGPVLPGRHAEADRLRRGGRRVRSAPVHRRRRRGGGTAPGGAGAAPESGRGGRAARHPPRAAALRVRPLRCRARGPTDASTGPRDRRRGRRGLAVDAGRRPPGPPGRHGPGHRRALPVRARLGRSRGAGRRSGSKEPPRRRYRTR